MADFPGLSAFHWTDSKDRHAFTECDISELSLEGEARIVPLLSPYGTCQGS